jgi:hypothetical protein
MEISGEGLRGLVILSVFLALSTASAANAPSSVGTDIAKIISINYLGADQWVEIANEGTGSIDLTGWTLMNVENHTYSFPANFTLKASSTVRVHSGYGDNTSPDLFNSTLLWSEMGDTATLKDAAGKIVSEYKYPIAVSAPGSVAEISPLSLQNVSSISGTSMPFLPDYGPAYGAKSGSLKYSSPVNLTGHTFICHGGPLNWAWTSGLE